MARKRPTHVTNLLTALWTWLKILRMPERGAGSAGAGFSSGNSETRNSAALCATAETWCISRSNVNVSSRVHDRFVNAGEEAGWVVHQFPMQKKGAIPVLRKCPDIEVNGQYWLSGSQHIRTADVSSLSSTYRHLGVGKLNLKLSVPTPRYIPLS